MLFKRIENRMACTPALSRKMGLLLLAALVALPGCKGAQPQKPAVGQAFVMDTVLDYKLFGENARRAADEVVSELTELEKKMSLYLPDSQISQLNAQAGKQAVQLDEQVFSLLDRSVDFSRESGGEFDITIAPLTTLWDVTAENPRVPPAEEISRRLALVNYRDVLLDPDKKTAMLARPGQEVDLGGVAKGYACDLAREILDRNGVTSGYLSIGGNLMIVGKNPLNNQDFKFGLRNPRGGPQDFIAVITLPDSTMATSGDYERYFEKDGARYHHILDPQTGAPAKSDLISVSVVTPDGTYADLMSTWLFLKGKDFALSHIDSYDCGIILIDKDRNVYLSESLRGQVRPSDPTKSYRFPEGMA